MFPAMLRWGWVIVWPDLDSLTSVRRRQIRNLARVQCHQRKQIKLTGLINSLATLSRAANVPEVRGMMTDPLGHLTRRSRGTRASWPSSSRSRALVIDSTANSASRSSGAAMRSNTPSGGKRLGTMRQASGHCTRARRGVRFIASRAARRGSCARRKGRRHCPTASGPAPTGRRRGRRHWACGSRRRRVRVPGTGSPAP